MRFIIKWTILLVSSVISAFMILAIVYGGDMTPVLCLQLPVLAFATGDLILDIERHSR